MSRTLSLSGTVKPMYSTERDVAEAISAGLTSPVLIASHLGVHVRTVNRATKSLHSKGLITQTHQQQPWSRTDKPLPPISDQNPTVTRSLNGESYLILPMTGGYLYAIEFSSGMIKVGRSAAPRVRISTHLREGKTFGFEMRNQWVSRSYKHPERAERDLIQWCRQNGQRSSGFEYFTNLIFSDVVRFAQTITDS